jgi:hypothetical protein
MLIIILVLENERKKKTTEGEKKINYKLIRLDG